VKLVDNTGTSLNEIVSSINHVADIVAEIAAASKEQATGVEEINKAVVQMDQMTQQNAALVEENAAASRTLQEEAENMQARMSSFTIGGDANAAAKTRPAKARPANGEASRAPAHKPVQKRAVKVANGGVGKMQAGLQAAFEEDADWKEF
jgi:uncharacterized phage infection (PIP) family protein YhgE